jgi:hypothetical protein
LLSQRIQATDEEASKFNFVLWFCYNNSTNTDCNLQYSKCKFKTLKASQLENDSKTGFF